MSGRTLGRTRATHCIENTLAHVEQNQRADAWMGPVWSDPQCGQRTVANSGARKRLRRQSQGRAFVKVVRPESLELPTPGLGNRCSILLSYGRVQTEAPVYQRLSVRLFVVVARKGLLYRCASSRGTKCVRISRPRQTRPGAMSTRRRRRSTTHQPDLWKRSSCTDTRRRTSPDRH